MTKLIILLVVIIAAVALIEFFKKGDDQTHERSDRQDRDQEVERILKAAGVPLLRLSNHGHFYPTNLAQKIKVALGNSVEQGVVTA